MSEIKDRINNIIEYLGITPYKLAKEIYTSEAVISNVRSGKTSPSFDLLQKILNKYEVLDANWLITGSGAMLKDLSQTKTPPKAIADEGVKKTGNKGQSAISLLKEIEIKQYEILANLKKISDQALIVQGTPEDESEYEDLIKQADKLRADWAKPGIGIRNKVPKKSEQGK